MPTRTWLTTPADQTPLIDDRRAGADHHVPGPGLPSEPRVPGRHRSLAVVITLAVITLSVITVTVIVGEEAQQLDPAAPDEGEQPIELPET